MHLANQPSGRVAQTSLMIAVQVPCERKEALQRLDIRAAGLRQSIEETALDVIDGLLRFDGLLPFDAMKLECPKCGTPMLESDEPGNPSIDPPQSKRPVYFCRTIDGGRAGRA